MEILGYGEDGLTLAFFCSSLPLFLCRLGDRSDPNNGTVYYRVSFGRRGGFGELDAMVVTPSTIYLCESKWNDSLPSRKKAADRRVKLRRPQVRRNRVLQEIVSTWLSEKPSSWANFREKHTDGFDGFQLPDAPRTLAKNLQSILHRLSCQNHQGVCENVLIYFYRAEMMDGQPLRVTNSQDQELDYKVVKVRYTYGDNGSHFELPSRWADGSTGLEFRIEKPR